MKIAKLGDAADFINGFAFEPSHWNGAGKQIIRIQNLTDVSKLFNRTNFEPGERYIARSGDLLVSWSATLGVFEWTGEDALVNQHIFRVIPKHGIHKRFLRYAIDKALLDMERHLHGATMKHVNRKEFLETPIYLPSREEQKRIAAILDKADAIRSKKRQAIKLLNQLIESGFVHFFGDCLNNSKNFATGTLAQLAGRIIDCPHNTPQYSETETGYFCVRSSDIQDTQINLSQTKFVTLETYEERIARHVPQAGEVIYTREGGRLGNAAQIPGDVNICLGQRMMLFSAKDKVSTNEFIWALLNSPGIRHQVDLLIAGAAAPRINIADIRRLEVLLPPFELQQQFSHFVQKVRDQQLKSSKSDDELGNLFDSLVQRAFRGEL